MDIPHRFESSTRAPGQARHQVASDLNAFSAELVSRACLVVSELVTNSVVHGPAVGSPRIDVVVRVLDGVLRIEVANGLQPFRFERGLPPPDSLTGRGLSVVEGAADRWGIEDGARTCVWAEFDGAAGVGLGGKG